MLGGVITWRVIGRHLLVLALCATNMASPSNVRHAGNGLLITMDDGKQHLAVPTSGEVWYVKQGGGVVPPDPEPSGVWQWPFPQRDVTCNYTCYPNHGGSDFAKPTGTPIKAIGDGVVYAKGDFGGEGAGRHIWIDHGVVGSRGVVKSGYFHMRDMPTLAVGARVKAGDIIGYVGSTGNSTGTHLHLEIAQNGTIWEIDTVDPEIFLVEVGASGR